MNAVLSAALHYATDLKWFVFPADPSSKKPLTPHGFKDATIDPETIRGWWRRWPKAMIGISCGPSRLTPLDVDVDSAKNIDGEVSLKTLLNGTLLPADQTVARTPRGGRHLYFAARDDLVVKNTAGKLGPGLDTRGEGGYVIAPPSINAAGIAYRWEHWGVFHSAPDWLVPASAPPAREPPVEPAQRPQDSRSGVRQGYGQAALRNECSRVAAAPEGERNSTLFASAAAIFELVAGGELSDGEARSALIQAAHIAGLSDREIGPTLASAEKTGSGKPRRAPPPRSVQAKVAKKTPPAAKQEYVANPLNLRRELHHDPRTEGMVGFDEFGHQTILLRPIPRPNLKGIRQFEPRPWSDSDDTALVEHFNASGFRRVGRDLVRSVVELDARSNPFHPVRDYLAGLAWDGTKRLSRFLIDYCGATADSETLEDRTDAATYVEAVTRGFFISAVARIFKPGCKCDCMLILEGSQGALKSRLLRTLATREDWFSDSLPHNLESKDAREHLAGRWLIEMSEIAQFRRSEIETVKSYLSCAVDKYRPSYGRSVVSVPRQCVFVGTTNAATYLHDPTGNRRFWPVRIGKIQLAKVEPSVDQLWAEAVAAYQAGEAWWLSSPKLERLAAREQQGRLELDPWHEMIADYVAHRTTGSGFTTAQILSTLGVEQDRRDRSHEMRVGNVLRALGCDRRRAQKAGTRQYVYFRPEDRAPEDE